MIQSTHSVFKLHGGHNIVGAGLMDGNFTNLTALSNKTNPMSLIDSYVHFGRRNRRTSRKSCLIFASLVWDVSPARRMVEFSRSLRRCWKSSDVFQLGDIGSLHSPLQFSHLPIICGGGCFRWQWLWAPNHKYQRCIMELVDLQGSYAI
jgi:hypothetical protein